MRSSIVLVQVEIFSEKRKKESIIRITDDLFGIKTILNMGTEIVSSLVYEDLDGLVHSVGRVLGQDAEGRCSSPHTA